MTSAPRPSSGWWQRRLDIASLRRSLLDREMPGGLTWWHTLGSATLTVFLLQAVTGAVLAMYYAPSPDHAYESIRYLEGQVHLGRVLRGVHNWGASAMVVLALLHMVRVFSFGAYKYPREANWVVGVGLLGLVMAFGFTGYLLPWDQRAYWATQVGTSIAGTVPGVGGAVAVLLRGGTQLGAETLTRFYALHVLWLPAAIIGLIGLHLVMIVRQGIAAPPRVLAGDEVADSLHGADRAPSQVPRRLSGTRRPDGTVRFTLSAVEVTAHRWQVQLLRAGDATLDPAVTVAEFGPGPPPVHSSGTHAVRTAGWLVVGVMATMMLVSSGGGW